jgi:hypothetical protein
MYLILIPNKTNKQKYTRDFEARACPSVRQSDESTPGLYFLHMKAKLVLKSAIKMTHLLRYMHKSSKWKTFFSTHKDKIYIISYCPLLVWGSDFQPIDFLILPRNLQILNILQHKFMDEISSLVHLDREMFIFKFIAQNFFLMVWYIIIIFIVKVKVKVNFSLRLCN